MNTSFGLTQLWTQGDWVTRSVALALLAMSLASWITILVKAFALKRARSQAQQLERFWQGKDWAEGLAQLGAQEDNAFAQLAAQGRIARNHHEASSAQLGGGLSLSDWMTRVLRNSMDESHARLQSGLAILASVGSTAPFVGLFGTVWGIYHALMSIGMAGQATIDKVAGPIGEALVMTALGLAVAIPAVLGYNSLVRASKGVHGQLGRFAHDLHAYFVTGSRINTAAVSA